MSAVAGWRGNRALALHGVQQQFPCGGLNEPKASLPVRSTRSVPLQEWHRKHGAELVLCSSCRFEHFRALLVRQSVGGRCHLVDLECQNLDQGSSGQAPNRRGSRGTPSDGRLRGSHCALRRVATIPTARTRQQLEEEASVDRARSSAARVITGITLPTSRRNARTSSASGCGSPRHSLPKRMHEVVPGARAKWKGHTGRAGNIRVDVDQCVTAAGGWCPEANPFPNAIRAKCSRPEANGLRGKRTTSSRTACAKSRCGKRSRTGVLARGRAFQAGTRALCIARKMALEPEVR